MSANPKPAYVELNHRSRFVYAWAPRYMQAAIANPVASDRNEAEVLAEDAVRFANAIYDELLRSGHVVEMAR